jgi:tRNA threonylcarbamoyl adenosine modification protein (Sua5/YciO/YrdC/YwlC family)
VAQYFRIHPATPQPRLIQQAASIIRGGGVAVYPTDSCYALGCQIGDKAAMQRIRQIRGVDERHHFTLVCRDLSEIANYARVDNVQYRWLKANTPGAYTFILPATKEVPNRLQHPKRKTVGLRVPEHAVTQALLHELGCPLASVTLQFPDEGLPVSAVDEIRDRLERQVDLVIDAGGCGLEPTTVIDLSMGAPELLRRGKGDPAPFGIS